MRCRRAQAAVVERGSGLLAPAEELALQRHLKGCPDCASEERIEHLLRAELSALRQEIPYPVDVRARVMPRIRASCRAAMVRGLLMGRSSSSCGGGAAGSTGP